MPVMMWAIGVKTYRRWKERTEDLRQGPKTAPANKLTSEEREMVLEGTSSKVPTFQLAKL